MKIVHVTTGYNHGGAAIACKRLVEAQREAGIDARVITQEKGDFNDYVISTTKTSFKKKLNFIQHAWEKFIFLFYEKSSLVRFQFSLGNSGEFISHLDIFKDADIIHFHWINAGFISLKEMRKIINSEKTVVWTLHDMWAFTGGCHYSGDCSNYKSSCGNCIYLKTPSSKDLSTKIFRDKQQLYSSGNLHIITPSKWLAGCAKQSSLLQNIPISVIPNAVSEIKINNDRNKMRQELGLPLDKKLILFGAFNLDHERKGSSYLKEALSQISEDSDFNILVFGKKSELFSELRLKTHFMGYSSDEEYIRKIYASADVYVNPSVEDNLPNTVLESLSVGTPVVAFNMGGMPDMIDHQKNGYLAEFKNSKQLSEGILWCVENNTNGHLSENAVQTIRSKFDYTVIGNQFRLFYKNILDAKS